MLLLVREVDIYLLGAVAKVISEGGNGVSMEWGAGILSVPVKPFIW